MIKRGLLFGLGVIVTLAPCGCRRTQVSEFKTLFEGFQLYMVDQFDSKADPQSVDPSLFHDTVPIGDAFEPGRIYFFKKVRTFRNEMLAVRVFPDRLRAIGATSIRAPEKGPGVFYPFIGPGIYNIEFEFKGRKAFLFNKTWYDQKKDSMEESIILVYR
jgi:hypothetical protein